MQNRVNAACAVFNSAAHNMRPVVLAVGGDERGSAEVYDFTKENSTWAESKIKFIHLISLYVSLKSLKVCLSVPKQLKSE